MQTKIKIDIRTLSDFAKRELAKYMAENNVVRVELGVKLSITDHAFVTWGKDNAEFLYVDENKRLTTGYSKNKFASHPFKAVEFSPATLA